jgi:hypothetical protein
MIFFGNKDWYMFVLQIEHEVFNFDGWKKAFESDPVNRKQAGVRCYSIFQQMDNPNFVVIDLEFDNLNEAENMLTSLKGLWVNISGKIIMNPQIRILKLVESKDI